MPTITKWVESPLPPHCPPEDAINPNNDTYYRLVDSFPPRKKDFYSQWKLSLGKKPFRKVDDCICKSCSIFATYEACNKIRKLNQIHKDKVIVSIVLPPESGLIKRTFAKENHYSWWLAKDFDPIPYCQEEV